MECHPVCDLFPEMAKQEFTDLCEDIAKHGQHTPIWTHAGQIVDGRHRYRACCLLGIAPKFEEWSGEGSLTAFVVSLNLRRRHLDTSQRAALGVEIKQRLVDEGRERMSTGGQKAGNHRPSKGRANLPDPTECYVDGRMVLEQLVPRTDEDLARSWRSREQAAEMVNVSGRAITDAEKVKKADPEAFEAIKRGEKTVHAAKRELEARTPAPRKRKDDPPAEASMLYLHYDARKAMADLRAFFATRPDEWLMLTSLFEAEANSAAHAV